MSTEAKVGHTPGPWRFDKHPEWSDWYGNVVGSYGKDEQGIEMVRTITCQTRYGTPEENEANARLIAAAPELLNALKLAYEALGESKGFHQSTTAITIRAAIAKGEGTER